MFSCKNLDDGHSYLVKDMSIQCWSQEHSQWTLGLALPGMIFWGLSTPLFATYLLYKNRSNLDKGSVIIQYGFLYRGFESSLYYWEVLIVLRKVLVTTVIVFFYNLDRSVQTLMCLGVVGIAYHIQEAYVPYFTKSLNSLEQKSLVVAVISIYCGLYFLTEEVNQTTQILLFCLMLAANLYFLSFWLYKVFERFPDYLRVQYPRLYQKSCFIRKSKIHDFDTDSPTARDSGRVAILPSISTKREYLKPVHNQIVFQDPIRISDQGGDRISEESFEASFDSLSQSPNTSRRNLIGSQESPSSRFGDTGRRFSRKSTARGTYLQELSSDMS